MTKFQKINSVVTGFFMIFAATVMMLYPNDSYVIVLAFLGFGFLLSGIKALFYYFTMAIYMVGGKASLYRGVILMNFGALTISLADVPKGYVLIYLAVLHAFSGLVEILRANETRINGSKSFKLKLCNGILNVSMAICCIIFARKTGTAVIIYSIGLIYSALIRIITAFRKTTFVYVR